STALKFATATILFASSVFPAPPSRLRQSSIATVEESRTSLCVREPIILLQIHSDSIGTAYCSALFPLTGTSELFHGPTAASWSLQSIRALRCWRTFELEVSSPR